MMMVLYIYHDHADAKEKNQGNSEIMAGVNWNHDPKKS